MIQINYGKNLIVKKIVNKLKNFYKKYQKNILIFFILSQPLLDVFTAVSVRMLDSYITIGSTIRFIFLLYSLVYLFFINETKYKKESIFYTLGIIIYLIIFGVIIIIQKDFNAFPYEIKNAVNTFYFPIILIALLNMFKQYKEDFNLKNFTILYIIYLVFIIVPNITNTSFLSYYHSKEGYIGWFLSANAVGSILSMILPIIIFNFTRDKKNIIFKILFLLATIYVFLNIGTKVPILSLMILVISLFIYCLIKFIMNKNFTKLIVLCSILIVGIISSIIIVPKTPFYRNLEIHREYLGIDSYFEVFTDYKLLDHFIFSQRLTFLKNTNNNYIKSSTIEKIFGIGYIENYKEENESLKTIEMDYFEVFYRHGIIGFVIFFSLFFSFIYNVIKKIIDNFNFYNFMSLISIILILLLALFSGHILVASTVSVFVSLLISITLTRKS